ncbi:hypothetical protein DFH27DRAFT_526151 [Peziza echinospora]|nr:hypothetical protein DFH27DRAFT_526151 [Peziza echinospora]
MSEFATVNMSYLNLQTRGLGYSQSREEEEEEEERSYFLRMRIHQHFRKIMTPAKLTCTIYIGITNRNMPRKRSTYCFGSKLSKYFEQDDCRITAPPLYTGTGNLRTPHTPLGGITATPQQGITARLQHTTGRNHGDTTTRNHGETAAHHWEESRRHHNKESRRDCSTPLGGITATPQQGILLSYDIERYLRAEYCSTELHIL